MGEEMIPVPDASEQSRRPTRRRRHLLVLATTAVAVVAAGTVAAAGVLGSDDQPPAGVEQALSGLFGDGRCVSATQAAEGIRGQLDGLGYSDWTISSRPGAEGERCVMPGVMAGQKTVVLLPVNRPDVVNAIQGVAVQLMEGPCLGKDQATELISSVLTGIGVTDFSVITDGPLGYPIGQEEAVRSRIASGCFVYSASGFTADGVPTFYLSGA